MIKTRFEISYNSAILIADRSELATLSIFYDSIIMPAVSTNYKFKLVGYSRSVGSKENYHFTGVIDDEESFQYQGKMYSGRSAYLKWRDDNKILFDEGVLKTLEKPRFAPSMFLSGKLESKLRYGMDVEDKFSAWFPYEISSDLLDINFALLKNRSAVKYDRRVIAGESWGAKREELETIYLPGDHLDHLLRGDIKLPSLFMVNDYDKREAMKALMAQCAVSYLLPKTREMHLEEVLAIREAVADTREGFSMHLQSLTAEMNDLLISGASFSVIAAHCKNIVDLKLIPDFHEFERQINSLNIKGVKDILSPAQDVISMKVAGFSPEILSFFLNSIGRLTEELLSSYRESLTNRGQAFQFMRTIRKKYAGEV